METGVGLLGEWNINRQRMTTSRCPCLSLCLLLSLSASPSVCLSLSLSAILSVCMYPSTLLADFSDVDNGERRALMVISFGYYNTDLLLGTILIII